MTKKTKKFYSHILLDRSGSMESARKPTIDAVNEYVNGLAKNDKLDTRVSLTIFDSVGIDLIADQIPVKDWIPLTEENYVPRAMTPLNDAIGVTVHKIGNEIRRKDERIAFTIVTDGLENASREFSKNAVKALIEACQQTKGWLVTFLAADQNAFQEGAVSRGIDPGNVMEFSKQAMGATIQSLSRAHSHYAVSGDATHAHFTDEERRTALGKEAKDAKSNS